MFWRPGRRGQDRGAIKKKAEHMETSRKRPPSDTSARRRASNELVKLIRKLRWLGMEEEAQGLLNELGRKLLVMTFWQSPGRTPDQSGG